MRDHDDGHAEVALNFEEQGENDFAGGGIEVTRRLVGEKNFGAVDQRTRDGGTLLFAAGKLGRPMADAFIETNVFERFANACGALGAIDFGEAQRKLDIFFEGHARKKVKGLKDHADGIAAVAGEVRGRKVREVLAVGADGAGSGAIEAGHEVEKGGFAGAGAAEEGQEITALNGEGDVVDGADDGSAEGVVPGNVVEVDDGLGVRHGAAAHL